MGSDVSHFNFSLTEREGGGVEGGGGSGKNPSLDFAVLSTAHGYLWITAKSQNGIPQPQLWKKKMNRGGFEPGSVYSPAECLNHCALGILWLVLTDLCAE